MFVYCAETRSRPAFACWEFILHGRAFRRPRCLLPAYICKTSCYASGRRGSQPSFSLPMILTRQLLLASAWCWRRRHPDVFRRYLMFPYLYLIPVNVPKMILPYSGGNCMKNSIWFISRRQAQSILYDKKTYKKLIFAWLFIGDLISIK